MQIAIAQTRPIVGQIEQNVDQHIRLLREAAAYGAELIVFPELSLTGYELRHADSQIVGVDDRRFAPLQSEVNHYHLAAVVGAPTPGIKLPRISALCLQPNRPVHIVSKKYLHPDEEPFFEPGPSADIQIHAEPCVALAICFELSVMTHADSAKQIGAEIYVASVAKTDKGVDKANLRLSQIAREQGIWCLMANSLGFQDGAECAGHSGVWDADGQRIACLGSDSEGFILLDSASGAAEMLKLRLTN